MQRTRLFRTVRLGTDSKSANAFQQEVSAEICPIIRSLHIVNLSGDLALPLASAVGRLDNLQVVHYVGMFRRPVPTKERLCPVFFEGDGAPATFAAPAFRNVTKLSIKWCHLTPANVKEILEMRSLLKLRLAECPCTPELRPSRDELECLKEEVAQLEGSPITDLTLESADIDHLLPFLPLLSNVRRLCLPASGDTAAHRGIAPYFPAVQHLQILCPLLPVLLDASLTRPNTLLEAVQSISVVVDTRFGSDRWFCEPGAVLKLLRPAHSLRYFEIRAVQAPIAALSELRQTLRRELPSLKVVLMAKK